MFTESKPVFIIRGLVRLLSIPIILILLVFNLRRILFSLAALFINPKDHSCRNIFGNQEPLYDILILVPCRNERNLIAGLCRSLERLDYPRERYRLVLIDDGSSDDTGVLMEQHARGKAGWSVIGLPANLGKAGALSAALERFKFGEIVYVFDADHRPEPDVLKRAVRYFDSPLVAGVSGRTIPSNPLASMSAYYSTVENYIHQMVTMRAKDRLGLAPALLGSNCGYRRTALVERAGFRNGVLLEDSDLTMTFYRAGYQIRFADDVVAYHQVPESVDGYLKQHRRWARGFNDVALIHSFAIAHNRKLSLPLRLELFLFSAGYLDRIALISAGLLTALSFLNDRLFQFPRQILYFALLAPLAQIIALFAEQKVSRAMWIRLPLVPVFFSLDVFSAARAMVDSLFRRPPVWIKTERLQHNGTEI